MQYQTTRLFSAFATKAFTTMLQISANVGMLSLMFAMAEMDQTHQIMQSIDNHVSWKCLHGF
jgi:hypothetical protein